MKKLMIILFLSMFSSPVLAANIYKWVDKDGVLNFTDDMGRVPAAYRDQVEVKTVKDVPEIGAEATNQPTVPKREEARLGPNGNHETWRREKILSWEKRLEEATSNYEKARDDLVRKGDWLAQVRYGSKTQYEFISVELRGIAQRLDGLRAQIVEAQNMLDKLSTESEGIEDVRQQQASSPVENEKIGTDLYGRDETWWKEKTRPWKEQLKEATENYERARDALVEQEEVLGPSKWGRLSLTQYQMISSRTVALSNEMARYGAQMSEAEGMLSKLSKEAQETRADPAWLQ